MYGELNFKRRDKKSSKCIQVEIGKKYNPYFINMNKKGGKTMANAALPRPVPCDMEVTPERALMIKRALIRQHEDQNGIEVTNWIEKKNGIEVIYQIEKKNGVEVICQMEKKKGQDFAPV